MGLSSTSSIQLDSGDNDHSMSQARGFRHQRDNRSQAPAFGRQELEDAPNQDGPPSVNIRSPRDTSASTNRGFQSTFGSNPTQLSLQHHGYLIQESPNDRETLDPRYQLQRSSFFTTGRVFSILWHEAAGYNGTVISARPQEGFLEGRFGQQIFGGIRRMVVVKPQSKWAWCLPITTYGGQGVAKLGVIPEQHAVVYMRGTRPRYGSHEPRMTKDPLEIEPATPDQKLDPMSRLNFGKVYTVEHNVKVLPVGIISPRSMNDFRGYARTEISTN
ncbi:uncharacterized protein ACLA_073620 [Aspergillus clavatus NRRL 1]|uniref:DUF6590 domain-containing protein n=1 Tax=Aspergillus clavatus (strain ATCC 1007 / CBS 513.65 / DSM 816 / NCTC 3887 / NRRL 1 / QM 1276 / 107) TaxID=344612 RepID=A1C7F6_ASPCL|nr:uncharacterized protein ACLA_073620 [Aspergillus clavatus NRRL 1]EAW14327.1 hypothetical protein ACLA_073620 [Aspergillus clavatus NRRL 1]